ncbi:MAG: hypothetical protein V4636_23770 [Pseudomonadota bacterium]
MSIRSSDTKAAAVVRPLRFATSLALVAVLGACGGSGSNGSGANGAATTPAGSTDQPTVVVTPNDPATAGPAASALVPPGASTDASATTPPARRPETVRCAP